MKTAISLNICVGRCAEEQMIPRIAAAGFDGIDFNFCDMLDRIDWHKPAAVDALLAPWQVSAEKGKLRWVQAHGPMFNMFGSTPQDEKARALCVPAIAACGRLGVPWVVLHPDVFAGAYDKAHRRAILDRNAEFFRSLLPHCEKHHVGIAIENIFDKAGRHGNRGCCRFFGAVPDELCALIDELNHPLIGACWDTGHARLMEHNMRECLVAVGYRLKALHIQENDGKDDDHMLPYACGRAGVNWPDVMQGLRDAGYQGPFTYETHNAYNAVPDVFLDEALRFGANIARYLVNSIAEPKSA